MLSNPFTLKTMITMNPTDKQDGQVIPVDFKNKKKVEETHIPDAISDIKNPIIEDQPTSKGRNDDYNAFSSDPVNANKLQFIIRQTMEIIGSQYPEIKTCRYGDILFLKEAVVSLVMRSWLNQEHPFQPMADKLEMSYNKGYDDSAK